MRIGCHLKHPIRRTNTIGITEQEWLASPLLLDDGAAFTEEQEAEILAAHDQRQLTGEAAPILLKPYVMPQIAAPPEDAEAKE
jgi:hypothetical protein